MERASVLHDIREDLDGMPGEVVADVRKLVDDARPALGAAFGDARARGSAVGATLVGHLPDDVIDRVPDRISDRLPGTPKGGSRLKKALLLGGIAAAAGAVAVAVRQWRTSRPVHSADPSANGHRPDQPVTMTEEEMDLPSNRSR